MSAPAAPPLPPAAPPLEPARGRVLVIDDEANARHALAELMREEGYLTEVAADGQEGLAALETFDPDVVLTDLKMPLLDGLQLLERGRRRAPHAAFLVMTAFGSIETAVEAIKRGAESYLTKPLSLEAVSALVARANEKARLSREATQLRARLEEPPTMGTILGDHPSMQRLLKTMVQIAGSRATVLIRGESGTGKELIAAAIHQSSPRHDKPFVRLNCAALAETLLESELFGHEKGAFTGAYARREGRFMQADGGTLLLDEISEVPLPLQVKLLRFLQERQFQRVGGNDTLTVDVRILAATNRDLEQQVRAGSFREDLFYRLNVVQLEVPPLRVRKSDVPILASHFLRRFAAENGRSIHGFSHEALKALLGYAWPGNVRELENAIERAVVLCEGELIGGEHLPGGSTAAPKEMGVLVPGITLEELERMAITQALEASEGSTAKAAQLLGVSRRKVQYRLRDWALNPRP